MARFFKNVKREVGSLMHWIDTHPRTGWYVVLVVTADLLLNIFEVVH